MPTTITLDCDRYPQPCWHYSSVISNNPHSACVTCPYAPEPYTKRGAVDEWYDEHDQYLVDADVECQADEWPAAKYIEVNDGYKNLEGHGNRVPKDGKQFIRPLSQTQNGAAGQKFKGCPKMARREDVQTEISLEAPAHGGNPHTEWTQVKAVYTRDIFSVSFGNYVAVADGDDGLTLNECANLKGVGDKTNYPGYPLLNRDPWFETEQGEEEVQYQELYDPANVMRKRDFLLNPDEIVVVGSNSSRRPTDEELRKIFGLIRCEDDCGQEIADLEQVEPNLRVLRPSSSSLMPAPAIASTTSVSAFVTDDVTTSERLSNFDSTNFPRQTPA